MSKRTESEQKAWQDGYTEGQTDEALDAVKEIGKVRAELGEEIENLISKLSSAREALAEIAGMATYVEGVAHASRIAKKGLEASE